MLKNEKPNLFWSLNIEIWDLLGIWCLEFEIYNKGQVFYAEKMVGNISAGARPAYKWCSIRRDRAGSHLILLPIQQNA